MTVFQLLWILLLIIVLLFLFHEPPGLPVFSFLYPYPTPPHHLSQSLSDTLNEPANPSSPQTLNSSILSPQLY